MKFTKIGKAFLMGALSLGVVFCVSSCIETYSVGYLYVTTTSTTQPSEEGYITGYKIEHNTGGLTKINGLPISSGGANPVRAVLTQASRFVYVLNRGANASGGSDCTTADPCENGNITLFVVGGNGILTPEQTYYTKGINPFRLAVDSTGSFLMVLDHDAPDSAAYTGDTPTSSDPNSCMEALGSSTTSCGDVTVFSINGTTGRLSLVQNQEVTLSSNGSSSYLNYFPVPANPVDFLLTTSYALTMSSSSTQTSYPYTGGSTVFPYAFSSSTGQLTITSNTSQSLGIAKGNAIVLASGVVYVLDNESLSYTSNGTTTEAASQIIPYTIGTYGALQAETSGAMPDDPTLSNPTSLLVESKGKFVYVANEGNNTTGTSTAGSGIAGYFLTTSPSYDLTFISGEPFGSGSGPQCIVEDPSDQYIFTANEYDSTVTGRTLDPNAGVLNVMSGPSSYTLPGPATWCLVDGRTD